MFDFGKELMRRRVPQIVGAYLAGGWVLLEFTDWTVNRYVLSPHLTDFVVASWLLLLPAVAMLAWNHGKPGRDAVTRGEAVGLGLNLVFAAVVLFSMFRGTDLGAATSSVQVTDEAGRTVTRTVPKPEFRRRVALFSFRNESGDPALDWLQFALPQAVRIDLQQDAFVTGVGASGRESESGDPSHPLLFAVARQREIASEWEAGSFLTGTLSRSPAGLEARVTLYETRTGSPRTERILSAEGPLELADSISARLRRDLGIPQGHIEATADLAVRELLSDSLEAVRAFFAGLFRTHLDAEAARRSFEEAAAEDSTFARALVWLGIQRVTANDGPAALSAFEAAIRHEYRLDEPTRFALRTEYFRVSQQPERALEVARMRTELYPDDAAGFEILAFLLRLRGDDAGALAAYERTLALDPSRSGILRQMGDLLLEAGRETEALERYRALADRDPESGRPDLALGAYFVRTGQLDSARARYERARVLDPGSPEPALGLAAVAAHRADLPDAEANLRDAARSLASPRDSVRYLERLSQLLELTGRTGESVEAGRRQAALQERLEGRAYAEQIRGFLASQFARVGDREEARALVDTMSARLQPPFDAIGHLADALVARELGDASTIRRTLPDVRALFASVGLGRALWLPDFLEAEASRLEGRCADAVDRYDSASRAPVPSTLFEVNREIGSDPITAHASCLRALGRYDEASDLLRLVLSRVPGEPHARVEMARLEAARGDREAALRELDAALATWADADPGYRPAIEARQLRAELAS